MAHIMVRLDLVRFCILHNLRIETRNGSDLTPGFVCDLFIADLLTFF